MRKTWISLATVAILGIGFTACNDSDSNSDKAIKATKVEFIGMDAPSTTEEMTKAYSAAKVRVYTDDTAYTEHNLSYNTLFNIQDKVGTNAYQAGQLYNVDMEPIMDPNNAPVLAETPDANSLLNVGGKLFLVSHLEYDWILANGAKAYTVENWYTRMPMSMLLTSIEQDESGQLKAVEQKALDFSAVGGIWIPCFGSQTPWNTHLGSEEDYDLYYNAGVSESKRENGVKALTEVYFKNQQTANPYHYGFITEVKVNKDASTEITKHYSMGKGTWEMSMVLSDGKTAYFGDDGKNVGMFMYVADNANDLTAGTLYAAKWTQTSAAGSDGGSADLSWIKLGHATDAEVKGYADSHTFTDIFDFVSEVDANGTTPAGYTQIRAGHNGLEYLKLKEGKETVAAFLEPRRYAALKGATTEWNKMEGVAFDSQDKKLYMAMSYIKDGMMTDSEAPKDDIQVAKNNCGATYEITLAGSQTDSDGNAIDSELVATGMSVPAALLGKPIATDANGNTCAVDSIANTDNVFFSDKMRTLFIGEDSGTHTNNFVWAYNVETKKLSRLLSLPAGAEATGLQVVENENGHAYIMSNAQHLGDFTSTTPDELKTTLSPSIDKFNAPIGYIGGMPGIK
ncbi:MAG: PhoX family protein [Epsilonproteobacteria bacterium]|nr:PhoX family protein [Campylobacterota bacterium]